MQRTLLVLGAAVAMGFAATAHADTDAGATPASETVTASLVLKVKNANELEQFVAATSDPTSPAYRRFMSLPEFVAAFSPSQRDVDRLVAYLAQNGITVTDVYADRLLVHATGPASAFNAVFSADLHDYTTQSGRYHRPHHQPHVPDVLADILDVVEGLDQSTSFRPHHVDGRSRVPVTRAQPVLPASGSTATGAPGDYTVGDVANLYDINPLYARHIDGRGRTIGIATLAGFDPNDAYQYWQLIGLDVKANRITQVHVDGGGVIGANAGTGETCLDVEQSGGLAPQAKIVVYDAPNTDAGFIDMFYKAASDNLVDTLSVSWGEGEAWYFAALEGGVDYTGELRAFHQAFLESAAQGMSLFASAGDDGAYDINFEGLSPVLTVDYPASDPAITAAGGTTVPASMDFGGPTPLVITTEQVWGWDYLANYFLDVLGIDISSEVYPTGGGGGVSIYWPRPDYQSFTPGVRRSEPNQSFIYDPGDGTGPQDLLDLPAHFAGRNLPDVSLNADPETGYILYSTPDGGLIDFYGGTSFVAPQLNGITALLGQATGGRLGLINPALYQMQRDRRDRSSPFVDITAGDNWFYKGVPGYDPGAGLGVLDVANLAAAFERR
jgi:kumamolisin